MNGYESSKTIVKGIVEERRIGKIRRMDGLAEKCKNCFHYRFEDPKKVKWDHTFVPTGYVCDYSVFREALRDMG